MLDFTYEYGLMLPIITSRYFNCLTFYDSNDLVLNFIILPSRSTSRYTINQSKIFTNGWDLLMIVFSSFPTPVADHLVMCVKN